MLYEKIDEHVKISQIFIVQYTQCHDPYCIKCCMVNYHGNLHEIMKSYIYINYKGRFHHNKLRHDHKSLHNM